MIFWKVLWRSRFSPSSWIYITAGKELQRWKLNKFCYRWECRAKGVPGEWEQIQRCWMFQDNPWGFWVYLSPFHAERKELINIVSARGIVHKGSFGRVIFIFRSIFSLWLIGWWTEEWSQPLMILKAPSLNNLCWFRDNSVKGRTHLAQCPFTYSEDFTILHLFYRHLQKLIMVWKEKYNQNKSVSVQWELPCPRLFYRPTKTAPLEEQYKCQERETKQRAFPLCWVTASFGIHLLWCRVLQLCRWISAPSRGAGVQLGCTTNYRGISALMAGESSPPPPSSLISMSAELFLWQILIPFFSCCYTTAFPPA